MNGSDIGLVLISLEGDLIQWFIRCGFKATNNEAEYEALIARLSLAKDMGIQKVDVLFDSLLVFNQLQCTHQAQDSKMQAYLTHAKELQSSFE